MRSVELFAGAGGLALASSQVGFRHDAVIEWDADACATLEGNKARGVEPIAHWPIVQADVTKFNFKAIPEGLDLLAGGPPCQPFSMGGKHRGQSDHRNMFPETVRIVRRLRPRAFVFENVRGLLRPSFLKYFEYIVLQLQYPEMTQRAGEAWTDHLARLERAHTQGRVKSLRYNVLFTPLNAADFGVPQTRHRVFIVGFRSDLELRWSFPQPTHSADALAFSKWISGEYWERHEVAKRNRGEPDAREKQRIRRMGPLYPPDELPWRTVRDAIRDLPTPGPDSTALNHLVNPGARPYQGHTGSKIDEPAKTLKAGDHGVPGGENMLALPSGRVRYFTVRESARLQTFPDDYEFRGAWSECMRQLGNAVPVQLGASVLEGVAARLASKVA